MNVSESKTVVKITYPGVVGFGICPHLIIRRTKNFTEYRYCSKKSMCPFQKHLDLVANRQKMVLCEKT